MSLHDDLERCSGCTARFRAGGCDSWGTEIPPCERDYDELEEEGDEENHAED